MKENQNEQKENIKLSDGFHIEKFIPEGRQNYRYEIFKEVGYIKYDGKNGKYIFKPLDEEAYTTACLKEINLFLEEINGQKVQKLT